MNKIDRLAGIVFILSRKSKVRASELAELFEVSERTIYRDIQALSELQVPIIAESGVSGGYSIASDYFLQLIILTEDESQAIFLGCEFIKNQHGFPYAKAAARALEKITKIIPKNNLSKAEAVLQKIVYNIPANQIDPELAKRLSLINQLIAEHQSAIIEYETPDRKVSTRKIDIYMLMYEFDAWHIIAYCHTRNDYRQFKLARIKRIEPTGEYFVPNELPEEPKETVSGAAERTIVIRITQNSNASLKVFENPYLRDNITANNQEYLELSFPDKWIRNNYLIQLVLSFGKDAEIISPPSLRQELQQELSAMQKIYET